MGILSRELRENYKRSQELSITICCIFLVFSCFRNYHSLLMANQCGDVSMRILEYESKRYAVRKQEVEEGKKRFIAGTLSDKVWNAFSPSRHDRILDKDIHT